MPSAFHLTSAATDPVTATTPQEPPSQHESLRRQEGKRGRARRHRLPGARHRAQLATGPRRQRQVPLHPVLGARRQQVRPQRSEEHTSELQSLMLISYAVFCLTKKKTTYADIA